ncbi:MAG: septum site-determining protein MinD [Clostridia bacterium]|nr:septum site-determining protein MinD [Clostridia bacterium]
MSKVISVISGKGGVGKTTVTANVGVALSLLGHKTVIIDTDLGLRNLDLALGLENNVIYDMVDLAMGECRLREAVIKDERYGALGFIPTSQFKTDNNIDFERFKKIILELKRQYEYIIIDSPAGIGEGFETAAKLSDMALIVVNPEPFSLRDADRVAGLLENLGVKDMRLIINRVRPQMIDRGIMLNLDSVIEALGVRLVGVLYEDESVIEAAIFGMPVVLNKKSKIADEFNSIAKRINGENVPIENIKKKSVWRKLLKKK